MSRPHRAVVFFQETANRRHIYAVSTDENGVTRGYGQLTLDRVETRVFAYPYELHGLPVGDPDLAADVAARPDTFHRLDDFFRVYGVAWPKSVEAVAASQPIPLRAVLAAILAIGRVTAGAAQTS
jgi:hypothetical protein